MTQQQVNPNPHTQWTGQQTPPINFKRKDKKKEKKEKKDKKKNKDSKCTQSCSDVVIILVFLVLCCNRER